MTSGRESPFTSRKASPGRPWNCGAPLGSTRVYRPWMPPKRPAWGGQQMPIVFRQAHMDDLKRADDLVVGSINELTERSGFRKMASSRLTPFSNLLVEGRCGRSLGRRGGGRNRWLRMELGLRRPLVSGPAVGSAWPSK